MTYAELLMIYLRLNGDARRACNCAMRNKGLVEEGYSCENRFYDLQIDAKFTLRIVHYWGEPQNQILSWNEDTGKTPAAFVYPVGYLSMETGQRPTELQCKLILDALGIDSSSAYEKLQLQYELTAV